MTPTPKVAAGGIAGAISILLIAVLAYFGVDVEPTVASAITALIGFGVAWLKREKGIDLDDPGL